MVVIKLFVFFYLKKLTLLYNCQPASRPYRASRSGTFFYFILIFGFAVALFPVAISISVWVKHFDRLFPYEAMYETVTSNLRISWASRVVFLNLLYLNCLESLPVLIADRFEIGLQCFMQWRHRSWPYLPGRKQCFGSWDLLVLPLFSFCCSGGLISF